MTYPYLVALLDPPRSLKFKHPCVNGQQIKQAVENICTTINWDPTEHYENFYQTIINADRLDNGEFLFIDLWESDLLASLIIGTTASVIQAAEEFGRAVEDGQTR